MHGKTWMFSHLIDDEDLMFLQHEYVSYRQASGNLRVTVSCHRFPEEKTIEFDVE